MRSSSHAIAISEINVTPLIDVMLCLLIIFMIAIPTLADRVSLDLPQPGPDLPEPAQPEPPMTVRILADGRLLLDQQPITAEVLAAEMSYQARRDKTRLLTIDADQEAQYQQVLAVLASAKERGIARIAMK